MTKVKDVSGSSSGRIQNLFCPGTQGRQVGQERNRVEIPLNTDAPADRVIPLSAVIKVSSPAPFVVAYAMLQ